MLIQNKLQLIDIVKKTTSLSLEQITTVISKLEELDALNIFWTSQQKSAQTDEIDLPSKFKMMSPMYNGFVVYQEMSGKYCYVDHQDVVRIVANSPKELSKKVKKYSS